MLSSFIIKRKIGLLAKQDSIFVQTVVLRKQKKSNIKYTHADLTGGFVLRGC